MSIINEQKKLIDNIKNTKLLLREYASRNDIVDAIQNMEVIKIYYQGDNTINRGYRTIEPHVIGKNKNGEILVRAWQQAGASDTKNTRPEKWGPKGWWRLFKLSGISSVLPTGYNFGYYPEKRNYNPDGDSQMVEILMQVDYDTDAKYKVHGVDSLDDPNVVQQRVKSFDPDYQGRDSVNSDEYFKGIVNNLYDMVKTSYKKSPNDYFVVKKGNKYYADRKKNIGKYDEKDIMGGLVSLARELNDIQDKERLPTTFIDSRRNKFINKQRKKEREREVSA